MAGHSKWKNIRIRKGKQDAIRGKLFTKLSREIIVAARAGGGDPSGNPRLRVAIEKAKENSMPAENISRAIQRGTGEIEGAAYEELTYEGYGPGGAAIMLECYTENKNRTVADLRHAFNKNGGNLAENGSVGWQFKRLGEITVPRGTHDPDEVTLMAIDAGAEDVEVDDEDLTIYTLIENLHTCNDALAKGGLKASEIGLIYKPTNFANPTSDDIPKLLKLMDALEDLDDVQETYMNVELTDDMIGED
jgi:YebC/PmpR family DNA-binding regulatory protein